jgi:hypothetical protein
VGGFSTTGVGVQGASSTGYGLRVASGRIKVDDVSGIATIPRGRKGVVVDPGVDINADTIVLVTPNANIGRGRHWIETDADSDTFIIRVSSRGGADVAFGWLMVEKG